MADGGEDFNLGHVVGSAGEKGDDGSTVWNTSTAPSYANSKYTFTISNLSGKTGLQIAVNDIIFYSTYYYIVSAVNTNTVDCSTRVSIKGSDATVTIATSFGSTPSDSKVPSEKLTKNSLDAKQATLVSGTNIKTVNNNSLLGSGNITIESGSNVDIVTSWEQTLSDSKVPSEKLVKNTIDTKADSSDIPTKTSDLTNDGADGTNVFVANNDSRLSDARTPTSHTHGQVTNDGKITSTAVTVATGDNIVITDYSDSSKIKRVANILADHVKDSTAHSNIGSSASATQATINSSIDTALSNKVSKSQTSGLLKNDGSVDTNSYLTTGSASSTYQPKLTSGTNIKTINNESLLGSGNITIQGGSSVDVVTSWEATLSDSKVPSEKLVKNTIDGLSIPTKTSDLTNDGDGTNVFVKNNDSRLTDSRTPTSHTHGNLTNDGKVGSNANYIVVTGTGGAITSVQKLGNITYDGKIGSTSGKPIITTTSGTLTTGSFGSTSGTFAEGNHTHSGYISTSSTTGLVKNDGTIMTSGTGSTNYSAGNHTHSGYISTSSTSGLIKNDGSIMTGGTGSSNWAIGNHTHSGYVSATKVTSWSGTVSDSNVPSEKLVKNSLDDKISKSSTSGLVKNDGTIDTSSYLTTGSASSTYQPKLVSGTNIKTVNNESLLGSGNITIQGGSSVDIVTQWESTPSDSKVASEKLTKDSLDGKANSTHEHYGDEVFSSIDLSNLGIFTDDSQDTVNLAINNAIGNKISKSQTVGLVKNDGSIDTNTYLTSSAISGMLTSSDVANNLTTTASGKVLDARQGKALADLIGDAITYINQ